MRNGSNVPETFLFAKNLGIKNSNGGRKIAGYFFVSSGLHVLGSSEVQWEECKKELAGKLVESCGLLDILKVFFFIFATF